MTEPMMISAYDPARGGCTTCGSQDTATVDGVHGRRCADDPPTFLRSHALGLLLDGQYLTALAYVRGAAS